MIEFNRSNWAKAEFSRGYQESADIIIMERGLMLSILQSFYVHFILNGTSKAVLDLGCGDGIVTATIAEVDPCISATLVDGSQDMLKKAKERLAGLKKTRYIHSSFQEMERKDFCLGKSDFIASSLAIHHLTMDEKRALFEKIYRLLKRGGYFVNIDVVLAPSVPLEKWFLSLWKNWIDEKKWDAGIADDRLDDIVQRYKDAEENKPDTLEDQLHALMAIGFEDVDCYYKHGIFTIYGGRK